MSTVGDILARAGLVLSDVDQRQWTKPELIGWFNEAITAVIRNRPEAGAVTESMALVPGGLQKLPAGGVQLLRVICNTVSKRIVRRTELDTLNNTYISWLSELASGDIRRYALDRENPREFFVYPATDGNASLEVVYAKTPTPVTLDTDDFPIPAVYESPVLNHILLRAFNRVSEDPTNDARASDYYAMFKEELGVTNSVMESRFNNGRAPILP